MQRRKIWRSIFARQLQSLTNGSNVAPMHSTLALRGGRAGMDTLTLFLRHDQSRTVEAIHEHLKSIGWLRDGRPDGIEVISWYVLTDISQVVTLRVLTGTMDAEHRPLGRSYPAELFERCDFRALYRQMQARCR